MDGGGPDAGKGTPACNQGGQVSTSVGLENPWGTATVGVCRRTLGCPSTWTLAKPDLTQENNGTPNQKLLYRVWYYGWSYLAGTASDQQAARDLLLAFFQLQDTFGHQAIAATGYDANEVLTSSHYEIWSNGMTCARLLAVLHQDAPVLQATGKWWRGEGALYNLLQRGGSIDTPGARDAAGGPLQLRDTVYAMIQGAPLPPPANKPTSAWWDDFYNVAAWTLREVLRVGDDLGGAKGATNADLPPLRDPLQVYTKGQDFVFEFPSMRGALMPLFWVASIGGTKSYAPIQGGNPTMPSVPAPTLAGATLVTVPGTP
jgi:hypothetical protein